jgi:hypothetical protein
MTELLTRDVRGKRVEFMEGTRPRNEGCRYGVVLDETYNPHDDSAGCWVKANRNGDIWGIRVARLRVLPD